MNYKILQIIPAPVGLRVKCRWHQVYGMGDAKFFHKTLDVICLALCEYEIGGRDVRPIVYDDGHFFEIPDGINGYEWGEPSKAAALPNKTDEPIAQITGISLGERIKASRKQAGLTQGELAEKLNVHQTIISQYENGSCKLSLDIALKLASVLGVAIKDLIDLKEELIVSGTFAENMLAARKAKGLTREKLGEGIGRTARSIARYEHGNIAIPFCVLRRIAKALGVPVYVLAGETAGE